MTATIHQKWTLYIEHPKICRRLIIAYASPITGILFYSYMYIHHPTLFALCYYVGAYVYDELYRTPWYSDRLQELFNVVSVSSSRFRANGDYNNYTRDSFETYTRSRRLGLVV